METLIQFIIWKTHQLDDSLNEMCTFFFFSFVFNKKGGKAGYMGLNIKRVRLNIKRVGTPSTKPQPQRTLQHQYKGKYRLRSKRTKQ
jgi:hypothetical protein